MSNSFQSNIEAHEERYQIQNTMFCNASTQTTKSIRDNRCNNLNTKCHPVQRTGIIQSTFTQYASNNLINKEEMKDDPIIRRMNPSCENDIKLLYSELKIWRRQQFEDIEQKRDISLEETIQLRSNVLAKETFLLRKINRLSKNVKFREKQNVLESKLDKIANPCYWILSNGDEIEVVTSSRSHFSEIVQMYQKYSRGIEQTGKA